MQTFTFHLPDPLATMFDKVCLESGQVRERVLCTLIEDYLEDIADYAAANAALKEGGASISLDEIECKYGLED